MNVWETTVFSCHLLDKLPDECGPIILDHTKQHCRNKQWSLLQPEHLWHYIYIYYIYNWKYQENLLWILADIGLRITGKSNLKEVNNLDITLNLTNSKYYLYRKPDNYLLYINAKSMHTVSFPVLSNGKNCNIPKLHAAMRAAQNVSSSSFNLFFEVKVELHPHKQNRPY